MQNPLFWIIIALIIFIVSREVMLWYWKINSIVKNQEEQIDIMDEILEQLKIANQQPSNEQTEYNVESTP